MSKSYDPSKAKEDGYKCAMKAWCKFIGKELEDMTEDMVTKVMFSKFSTYLVGRNLQHSVTKKKIVKN